MLQVMAKVKASGETHTGETSMTECVFLAIHSSSAGSSVYSRDDHYYQLQSERSRILSEKETLEKVYQTLMEEHRTLQSSLDDALSEKEETLAQLRQAQRDVENRKPDSRNDALMRAEIDRLRSEL